MKTFTLLILSAVFTFTLTSDVHSQAVLLPRTPLQHLQAMKVENAKLLEKQDATLKKLEELRLESQQIKFLGKRS